MTRVKEPIIHDGNYKQHIGVLIDGEVKGHGLIPRDYSVYPQEMFDPPSQLKLIPRSEWQARIQEQEQRKSRISDILLSGDDGKPIPSLDQGPNGYCVTEDTEVLTDKGWVEFPKYNWTDLLATVNPVTHAMEFQAPFQKHVYEYSGPMVYSTNKRVDFGVTPDHQMYVRKWDEKARTLSDRYSFVKAKDIGWYSGLLGSPSGWIGTRLVKVAIPGDREYSGDNLVKLLGLIVSDGYAGGTDNTKTWVSFASFRPERREEIKNLVGRMGFIESPSRPGVWVKYSIGLANWIRTHCYTSPNLRASNKKVPDLIKSCSTDQIRLFLDWFDDRNRAGSQYYSVSKRLIDDLQELFLRVGKRATVDSRPVRETEFNGKPIRSKECYYLTVSSSDSLSLERKHNLETDSYKGLVYCAGVPNHTLITRRNGSVLVSSNCWGHSTGGCVQAVRAINGQPYVPLSCYMVCAIIKRGRNEGGWCGLSAKFMREVGICTQKTWPQGDRNTSRDTPEVRAEASKYRVMEEWVDLTRDVYDQNLNMDMVITCLLMGIPVAGDFNWWAHSVLLCDACWVDGAIAIRFRNSWGDGYGNKGFGVLQGNKAITNGAVAIRVSGTGL